MADNRLQILDEEDLATIEKSKTKQWVAPIAAMAISSLLIVAYRKINFPKLLPNPLGRPKNTTIIKMDEVLQTKTKRNLMLHTVIMLGFTTTVGAYIAK